MNVVISAVGFGLVTAAILALGAVGFTLQFGVTNVLNLAYTGVLSIAAFVALSLNLAGLNIWWCVLVAGVAGALASLLLNLFVYKPFIRRGTKLFGMVIVSIAVLLILEHGLQAIVGVSFFSFRFDSGGVVRWGALVFTTVQLVTMGLALVAMLLLHIGMRYTRLGKAMRATANDPSLARACGIRTARVVNIAWLASGFLCGVGGVLLFMDTSTFSATTGNEFLIVIIAAAVLGGIGDAYGAVIGALIVGIATEVAAALITPSAKEIVAFAILVLVLIVRPSGLFAKSTSQKQFAK